MDVFEKRISQSMEAAERIRQQKAGVLFWIDGKKVAHPLPAMSTLYLFNTVKMCVNRALPYHLRLNDNQKNTVQIPDREMKALISGMFKELKTRDNMTEESFLQCAKLAELARKHL